ncbi:nucleotidyltransferase domain-containing protein [Rickettsiales bacterium]|nr:nucleotidyltransferase domain-containing protein [Rickettsiales bacterium]
MLIENKDFEIIKNILISNIPEYEVRAFGSRVHGNNIKPFSDVDLAIVTETPLDDSKYITLKQDFENSNLPVKVDIVDWAIIDEDFRKVISENFEIIQKAK